MIKHGITVFLFFLIAQTFGQLGIEYYHALNYTSNNGLPHNLVFDMTQSDDGFVWVATNNGLGRFDGYNFKTYRPEKNKNYNISGKSISKLKLDNKNNLWLGIQGHGLNRMDLETERFYNYFPDSLNPNAISGNDIRSIFQDSDSMVWVGSNKGLDYYNEVSDGFVNCIRSDDNGQNTVNSIFADVSGKIWFRTNVNFGCYDKKTKQVAYVKDIFEDQWPDSMQVQFILNEGNKLWVSTYSRGLFCFNLTTSRLDIHITELKNLGKMHISENGDMYVIRKENCSSLIRIPNISINHTEYESILDFGSLMLNYFVSFNEDLFGNIWIVTGEGLYKIDENKSVSKIYSKNYINSGLLQKNVTAHFIDNMGNFWLSSERKGVVMIDLFQKQFKSYKTLQQVNDIISGDNIGMVYEDSKGRLWVGCYDVGIVCYDSLIQSYQSIRFGSNQHTDMIFSAPAGIVEDSEGDIWIGFYDGGLLKIDGKTLAQSYEFGTRQGINNYEFGHSIRSIVLDDKDNLWIASNSNGLIERKSKSGELVFHSELYEKEFLTNSHYRFVTQTYDGMIWTGTQNGGLGSYNVEKKEFIHYRNNSNDNYSISGNTVYYVYEQSDSILWIGTDKGLNKFNRNNEKFQKFQIEKDGFICGIYRIYPDKDSNLWMSSDCGLICFNLQTLNHTIYERSDGLPSNEFNTTAGCLGNTGEMFFGSSNGLLSFYPEAISSNPFYPKPLLTQLKIFNQEVSAGDTISSHVVLSKELAVTDGLKLPYNLNDFTIEFSAMHFASPEKNNYEYLLEGFSDEWIAVNANRRWANFTGLNPGRYTFHLKATNNDGMMSAKMDEVILSIEITPPFYKTLLFRIVLLILITVLVRLIYSKRIRNIHMQKHHLEKTVKVRTGELQKKNALLEERQEEISLQKEELLKHRNHLEELVDTRTSKLKIALKKAEESDRLKSAFLSNMSHEIRTPMNAILGFSGLLLESNYSDEEKFEFLGMVHSNGETLMNLLNDIIDISLIESGQLKIHQTEFELNSLMVDVSETFKISKALVENDGLTFSLLIHCSETIRLSTDVIRLKQILSNLLNNALKYTKKGSITLSVTHTDKLLTFGVVDTGIGIEENKQSMIFNRFQKIEDSNDELYRGGGLGLTICKNLVESMGGEIWVNSKVNEGSSFFFTLPV